MSDFRYVTPLVKDTIDFSLGIVKGMMHSLALKKKSNNDKKKKNSTR